MWLPHYEDMQKGESNRSEIIKGVISLCPGFTDTHKERNTESIIKYLLTVYIILSTNSSRDVWQGGISKTKARSNE